MAKYDEDRKRYICEYCLRGYATIQKAEKCERIHGKQILKSMVMLDEIQRRAYDNKRMA